MDQFMPKSVSVPKQGQIDIALGKMIATDFQIFSIVEDRGFRNHNNSIRVVVSGRIGPMRSVVSVHDDI
jgi:hypothetical protein